MKKVSRKTATAMTVGQIRAIIAVLRKVFPFEITLTPGPGFSASSRKPVVPPDNDFMTLGHELMTTSHEIMEHWTQALAVGSREFVEKWRAGPSRARAVTSRPCPRTVPGFSPFPNFPRTAKILLWSWPRLVHDSGPGQSVERGRHGNGSGREDGLVMQDWRPGMAFESGAICHGERSR